MAATATTKTPPMYHRNIPLGPFREEPGDGGVVPMNVEEEEVTQLQFVDGKCTCCPYGYHVNVDFLRYADNVNNGNHLHHLKKIHKNKRKLRKDMEVFLHQDTEERVVYKPPPDVVHTTDNYRKMVQYEDSATHQILDEIDTSVNQTISSIDQLIRTGRQNTTHEQIQYNTMPDMRYRDHRYHTEHEIHAQPPPQLSLKGKSDSVSSLSSQSTHSSEPSSSMFSNTSNQQQHYTTQTTTTTITSQQLAETMAAHFPHDHGPSGMSQESLRAIREQISVSLQRMRELEEQVKSIPVLQVRLSVLKEEKRLLALQLEASNKQVEQLKHTAQKVEEKYSTVQHLHLATPPKPKPVTHSIGVGDGNVFEQYQVVSSTNGHEIRTHDSEHTAESTVIREKEILMIGQEARRTGGLFAQRKPLEKKVATRSIGVGDNNVFDLSSNVHVHEKELRTVIIGKENQKKTRNVGIECRVPMRDVAVSYMFEEEPVATRTVAVGVGEIGVCDMLAHEGEGSESSSSSTTTTSWSTQHTRLQQLQMAQFSRGFNFSSSEMRVLLDEMLKKSVHSVGIQTSMPSVDAAVQHVGYDMVSVGCSNDSIDVSVTPFKQMRSIGIDHRPHMVSRGVAADKMFTMDMSTNTPRPQPIHRSTNTQAVMKFPASTNTEAQRTYSMQTETEMKMFLAMDQLKNRSTNTEKADTYNMGVNTDYVKFADDTDHDHRPSFQGEIVSRHIGRDLHSGQVRQEHAEKEREFVSRFTGRDIHTDQVTQQHTDTQAGQQSVHTEVEYTIGSKPREMHSEVQYTTHHERPHVETQVTEKTVRTSSRGSYGAQSSSETNEDLFSRLGVQSLESGGMETSLDIDSGHGGGVRTERVVEHTETTSHGGGGYETQVEIDRGRGSGGMRFVREVETSYVGSKPVNQTSNVYLQGAEGDAGVDVGGGGTSQRTYHSEVHVTGSKSRTGIPQSTARRMRIDGGQMLHQEGSQRSWQEESGSRSPRISSRKIQIERGGQTVQEERTSRTWQEESGSRSPRLSGSHKIRVEGSGQGLQQEESVSRSWQEESGSGSPRLDGSSLITKKEVKITRSSGGSTKPQGSMLSRARKALAASGLQDSDAQQTTGESRVTTKRTKRVYTSGGLHGEGLLVADDSEAGGMSMEGGQEISSGGGMSTCLTSSDGMSSSQMSHSSGGGMSVSTSGISSGQMSYSSSGGMSSGSQMSHSSSGGMSSSSQMSHSSSGGMSSSNQMSHSSGGSMSSGSQMSHSSSGGMSAGSQMSHSSSGGMSSGSQMSHSSSGGMSSSSQVSHSSSGGMASSGGMSSGDQMSLLSTGGMSSSDQMSHSSTGGMSSSSKITSTGGMSSGTQMISGEGMSAGSHMISGGSRLTSSQVTSSSGISSEALMLGGGFSSDISEALDTLSEELGVRSGGGKVVRTETHTERRMISGEPMETVTTVTSHSTGDTLNGSLKSCMKQAAFQEPPSPTKKKGISFAEEVSGGYVTSSTEEEEHSDSEGSQSSFDEGSYDGREGKVIYTCKDDEAIAQGKPGAMMFDQNIRETFELSPEMNRCCDTYAMWLKDSVSISARQLNSALNSIQQGWFKVSSHKLSNPAEVEDHLTAFKEMSPELLENIVNMADNNGNTGLHYAVSHCNMEIVNLLLDTQMCDTNKQNKAGYTAIMLASLAQVHTDRDRDIIRRLFNLGNVNARASQAGQTALMLAVSHGRLDMVKLLMECGAAVNAQDDDGSTALMCACEHGHAEIVKVLLGQPDCDPSIEDNDGSTALSIAMEAGHRDVGVLLYAHVNFKAGTSPEARRKVTSSSSSYTYSSY